LVTPIWPVSGLEAGGVAPISFKLNKHAHINSVEEVNGAHWLRRREVILGRCKR